MSPALWYMFSLFEIVIFKKIVFSWLFWICKIKYSCELLLIFLKVRRNIVWRSFLRKNRKYLIHLNLQICPKKISKDILSECMPNLNSYLNDKVSGLSSYWNYTKLWNMQYKHLITTVVRWKCLESMKISKL